MAKPDDESPRGSVEPATDRFNAPVADPTRNVLDLVDSAIRRQDDLRTIATAHLAEIVKMNAAHERELRIAEAARIDAIRAVDVAAVQTAATQAEVRATALAAQVTATADAFRTALTASLEPLQEQLGVVSRYMYEGQGSKDRGASSQGIVFAVVGLLMTAVIIAVGVYAATN